MAVERISHLGNGAVEEIDDVDTPKTGVVAPRIMCNS
jgi:hypothetical protein